MEFTDRETTIRTWWMRAFLCTLAINVIYTLRSIDDYRALPLWGIIFALGLNLFWNFGLYYFGYRKLGTKFLTTYISFVCIGIGMLSLCFLLHYLVPKSPVAMGMYFGMTQGLKHNYGKQGIIVMLLSHLTSLAFLIASIRLRRMNRTRKAAAAL